MKANAGKVGSQSVYARMSALLGVALRSEADAVKVVTKGLSAKSYRHLAKKLGFEAKLIAPESTVRRRLENDSRFTQCESERLLRLARIFAEATELFGDETRAKTWVKTPANYLPDLGPVTPLEVCSTEPGARLIEGHLLRTAHGIF